MSRVLVPLLLLLLLPSLAGVAGDPAMDGGDVPCSWAYRLRTYTATGLPQQDLLAIGPDEDWDRYLFCLLAPPGQHVSAAHVEVHRVGVADLECRMELAAVGFFHVNHFCDTLRPNWDHHVRWAAPEGSVLHVHGVDRR